MEEYNRILQEIHDYLSYPDVIYNNEVLSANDLVVIMNNAYKKCGVFYDDDELKKRLNFMYPIIYRRIYKKKINSDVIRDIKVIGGVNVSKIRIVRNFSDGCGDLVTYICKDNDSGALFIEGDPIEEYIIDRYRNDFIESFSKVPTDVIVPVSFPTEVVSDGVITVTISYDEFKGAITHVTINSDKTGVVDRKYFGHTSIREFLDSQEVKVLRKMPVKISELNDGTREYVRGCIGDPEVIRKLRKY